IHNEQTVEVLDSEQVETAFDELPLHCFSDRIQGRHPLALVKGTPDAESVTTVRVHVQDPMRDLLTLRQPGSSSRALNDALAEVAAADA
ncbi:bifunctional 3,4-dihydroxy-2-butanone-4-phosphate synthase/GTP cyclohydrolase II, partial [Cobetia sp. SIMBA_158]